VFHAPPGEPGILSPSSSSSMRGCCEESGGGRSDRAAIAILSVVLNRRLREIEKNKGMKGKEREREKG
jgi:hypothetical protein